MKVLVKRIFNCNTYCIGHLYVDDKYVCDTIEDTDRGLAQNMPLTKIKDIKVFAKTAIPTGTYPLTLNVKSPKFSKKQYYRDCCNGYVPRILEVPGFEGILIHVGSTADSSAGCVIVGYNKVKGRVTDSTTAFEKLLNIIGEAKDKLVIEITSTY